MVKKTTISIADRIAQVRSQFKTRDFIFHDGRDLRRFSIAGGTQAALAGVAGITLCFSAYGVAHAAVTAVQLSGVLETPASPEVKVVQLQNKLVTMQANLAAVKYAAEVHAARVEQRQALIAAVLEGKKGTKVALTTQPIDAKTAAAAADVIAPFKRVEQRQLALAVKARALAEARYMLAANNVRRLGFAPERFLPRKVAVGGPFEPIDSGASVADAEADKQFRSLFMTWKKLDSLERGVIAIPSAQPVTRVSFTSSYGVRSDPFRGVAAMHAGVDIPGAIGTPVYATADGIVSRSERAGGYGNMIEVDHGRGIATRYGHLSKLLVVPNTRVVRGQLIALMGSTGRSTGSHLHYEVRIDGQAVNPIPFLQSADFLRSVQDQALVAKLAVGGPRGAK
ncbi:M23 family metallopeptidase [Sphingomonas sp. 28-63-12]|uniref:M23 family metallopeptidase n=1 Tax=Sphingomonas sp. 28-63-12 TaxID=1970434 RepID=UPI000BD3B936|nr:MAG: peptidase M23 [Sphingomonas sp. 28-63-12]